MEISGCKIQLSLWQLSIFLSLVSNRLRLYNVRTRWLWFISIFQFKPINSISELGTVWIGFCLFFKFKLLLQVKNYFYRIPFNIPCLEEPTCHDILAIEFWYPSSLCPPVALVTIEREYCFHSLGLCFSKQV